MKDEKNFQNNPGKENEPVLENGKKKSKEEKPPTKVVVRRLPPSMTEEQFKVQVSPLPDFDYFYFVSADMTLSPNSFSRAYINFLDQNDLFIFTQKFDGYVFVDSKGGEYPAVVEFAPFQRIPKNRPNRKKDPKIGTIEADAFYIAFKEQLEAENLEKKASANVSKQHFFETSVISEKKETNNTPLLDFIKNRKAERQRIRDEKREEKRKKDLERRRAKEDQKRIKKEDETSVVKVLNSSNPSKEKETKPSLIKKKADDAKLVMKEKHSSDLRSKEGKSRTGKSYLEERQRQAERREEQRKKLTKSQSNSSVAEPKLEDKELNEAEGETHNTQDEKTKDTEHKKLDKRPKKEVVKRSSYKYENKKDKESDDPRRTKRSDKGYTGNKREDERNDDVNKKRYSETRKSYDSQRDKYKERDKNKTYDKKKSTSSNAETIKTKSNENSIVEIDPVEDDEKVQSVKDRGEMSGNNKITKPKVEVEKWASKSSFVLKDTKTDISKDKASLIRRNSLDCNTLITNIDKVEFVDQKRRMSVDSSEPNTETEHFNSFLKSLCSDNNNEDQETLKNVNILSFEHVKMSLEEKHSSSGFEDQEEDVLKRRNSTGDRQSLEKCSPRRNSLGSEDKSKPCTFIDSTVSSRKICEESISKERNIGRKERNSCDPRTERRIRNKDRPSIEIYRPGMGKFSKQRMKNPSSSTEVDSPSSSPSPTPIMKHKSSVPSN